MRNLKKGYITDKNDCLSSIGWKFYVSDGDKKINISSKILNHIDEKNILKLNKPYKLVELFKIDELKINKYNDHFLLIENKKIKNWESLTIKDNSSIKIDLTKNLEHEYQEINIIYFFNAMLSPLFYKLFYTQLKSLLKSYIFNRRYTKLYIVCVADSPRSAKITKLLEKLRLNRNKNIQIEFINNCTYEFEGIKKVFEVSKKSNNSYIMYFHGKGISHLKTKILFLRHPYEVLSFNRVIKNWKKNIEWFTRVKNMNKLGLLNSDGWMLFNFWWAKSSYLNELEPPIKTNDRYYYENWISRLPIKKKLSVNGNLNHSSNTNDRESKYLNTIDTCINIIYSTKLKKYNIGTTCHVGAKDMIYLGIHEFLYLPWYRLIKILNILLRKQKL